MKKIYFLSFLLIYTYRLAAQPLPAADEPESWLPGLKGKKIGLVVNQTSISKDKHLVDRLLSEKITIVRIFCPEHGFRGTADAGEKVNNETDPTTGLPLVSLYGKNKKPLPEQLKDLDLVVFDIQDVGVRFYTYISTLHLVMEACAENNKHLLILDRPNPNGMYVDGPVLDTLYRSFVGMHPIPVVHGLTIGELALMINGERWLKNKITCKVDVVPCLRYTHKSRYALPVKPSPNLPNARAIALYPSLCLFEGTDISVGRGTLLPFQGFGYPDSTFGPFVFTPESVQGAKSPLHAKKKCYGTDLSRQPMNYRFTLAYLLEAYSHWKDKKTFFNPFFRKLIGNAETEQMVLEGRNEAEIRKTWQPALNNYKTMRKKYLLYPD